MKCDCFNLWQALLHLTGVVGCFARAGLKEQTWLDFCKGPITMSPTSHHICKTLNKEANSFPDCQQPSRFWVIENISISFSWLPATFPGDTVKMLLEYYHAVLLCEMTKKEIPGEEWISLKSINTSRITVGLSFCF